MNISEFREYYRKKFPYHNIRPQQIKMMEGIFHSVINKKNLIVEAPTGVGKTLSYLIPSLYFGEKGKRIILLTETIDQQERIVEDLHSLKHNLNISFIMGRRNFFCKSKNGEADSFYCQLNRRCKYRPNKRIECYCGTRKEPFTFNGEIKYYCPFCICDYQKTKIKCLKADIVIMNYSIYYHIKEDIDDNRETDIIICDEAHKLEGSIRKSATISINPNVPLRRLKFMALSYATGTVKKYLQQVDEEDDERFWEIVYNYVSKYGDIEACKSALIFDDGEIESWNLKKDVAILGTLYDSYREISKIKEIIDSFDKNVELDRSVLNFKVENREVIPIEFSFTQSKKIPNMQIMEFIDNITSLNTITDNFVIYKNDEDILLCEPVMVSPYLKKLYGDGTVIHCSATIGNLKIHGLKTGMGQCNSMVLDSPFSKDRKMIVALKDGVDMKYDSNKHLKRKIANENILKLLKNANCNSLVLFKSFDDLNSAYNYLISSGQLKSDIYVYQPGMDGKEAKRLKETFEKNGGVLLATGRFAEGVDIPGDALTMVIIDSLPFPVPTPLINREQRIIKEGFKKKRYGEKESHWISFLMTSFHIMSRTVVQMIGRLIRTENDYGVVVIQDKRFYSWVGKEMIRRGYLKDDYTAMTLNEALDNIPKFLNKFRNKVY